MGYDAILFDLDGVLLGGYQTPRSVYRRATERLLYAFGHAVSSEEWDDAFEEPSSADAFRRACAGYDLPPDAAWGYRERAASDIAYPGLGDGERSPFDDTETLSTLAENHHIGICSNNRHETVGDCIDLFGWETYVSAYRGRFPTLEDYDRRKPKPAYLEWVIARLPIESAIFVGDRPSDVQTAEAVGCDAALLTREGDPPTTEGIEPTYHIQRLTELVDIVEGDSP